MADGTGATPPNDFCGFPIKYDHRIPEGYVLFHGYYESGQGTLDLTEERGAVIRPDGVVVRFVRRNGKLIVET